MPKKSIEQVDVKDKTVLVRSISMCRSMKRET